MAEQEHTHSLRAAPGAPLIGVPVGPDEGVRYFTEEQEAYQAAGTAVNDALAVAGIWHDLSWEELADGLDRIRHESDPTPPLSL